MTPTRSGTLPDFSMLADDVLVKLVLQRGSRVGRLFPPRKNHPEDWTRIYLDIVGKNRDQVVQTIWSEICDVYDTLAPTITDLSPSRVADVGCGQAFVDLLIHRDTGADLLLIDIEETDDVFFGYKPAGAGYASLDTARAFLEANGVPSGAIETVNPVKEDLQASGPVDLAISLISCGFHYPAETYETFFADQVKKAILLDVRKGKGNEDFLSQFGPVSVIAEGKRHHTVVSRKSAA